MQARGLPTFFKSLRLFVRDFVMKRIDHASTVYMGTIRQDTIERIKAGEFQEFFKVRNEYRLSLVARLENYLRSDAFAELSGASGSPAHVKTYRWSSSSLSSLSTVLGLVLRSLWVQQQKVSAFGTFVVSVFGVAEGFIFVYFAQNDMVTFRWRTIAFFHSLAIAGYWAIAVFSFLFAMFGLAVVIQKIFRR